MKIHHILLMMVTLMVALTQPTCLLQEPLTDHCIESIDLSMVEQEMTKYLCTISFERKLYKKAEQFCRQATPTQYESGYLYFNTLLANNKPINALRIDYMLFFTNPFDHNAQLTSSIQTISSLLAQLQANPEQFSQLDDMDKAVLYFYLNQTQKSLEHLKSHLSLHKQSKALVYEHFLMIRILQKQYKYYEALEYIKNVLKENSVIHPYFYHIKGNLLMHHIQFQKAITQFDKSNAQFHKMYKSNGFSFSNYNIGLCYEKLGDTEQAIKYYEKSIINLGSAEALNALGHAHHSSYEKTKSKKDLETAETYYKKSIQAKPQYKIAIFNLGMLELEKNNLNAAIENFERCSSQIRSCKYGLLKAYYKSKNMEKISSILQSIDKNQETITELAAILYEMNDYAKAINIIGARQYKSSQLYEWKGFNLFAMDRYEQAETAFARAIFLGNKQGHVYYSLGLSQLHLKKYGDCARSFEYAYKLDPRKDTKEQLENCMKLQVENDL